MRAKRGNQSLQQAAGDAGVPFSTLSRIERGTHAPSADTALALARWLGWSMEQVMEASKTPIIPEDGHGGP